MKIVKTTLSATASGPKTEMKRTYAWTCQRKLLLLLLWLRHTISGTAKRHDRNHTVDPFPAAKDEDPACTEGSKGEALSKCEGL